MGDRKFAPIVRATLVVALAASALLAFANTEPAEAAVVRVRVTKIIDADGDTLTTGDQTPGIGWTFVITPVPPDFATPPSPLTDGSGIARSDVDLGVDDSALINIDEVVQSGFSFVSASCLDGATPTGTPSGASVKSIPLNPASAIFCVFYNTPVVAATADVKITSQSLSAPPSANTGVPFSILVNKVLHNNGPASLAGATITPSVLGPPDCTITPDPTNPASATLPSSTPTNVLERFNVICMQPSTHQFTVSNCVTVIPPLTDPNVLNNCVASQIVTTTIVGQSDVKVTSVATNAPASVTLGIPFAVSANVGRHNNGPFGPTNVDTTITLSLPPGCSTPSPNPQSVQNNLLSPSVTSATGASWTVTCFSPSNHLFQTTASVAVDQQHVTDLIGGNNTGISSIRTVAVTTTADVKITSVVTSAPPAATSGAAFGVVANVGRHNNGPFGPVTVSTSITLNLPPGCTTASPNPQVQAGSLPTSVSSPTGASWGVVCINGSNHSFTTFASLSSAQQLHVADPNVNNSATSTPSTTAVSAIADVKVTAVTLNGPPSAPAGTNFGVSSSVTLHNNGPTSPVNVDTTVTLLLPSDCVSVGPNPVVIQDTSLPGSTPITPGVSFTVRCTDGSNHAFRTRVDAVIDQLHVTDPSPSAGVSNTLNTAINALADAKVTAVSGSAPAGANANTPFNVSAAVTIHNNGPFGPANTDTTVTLLLPPDCTTSSPNPQVINSPSTAVSVANVLTPAVWSVICTSPSNHDFRANASVRISQLHVQDSNPGNDFRSTNNIPVAISGVSDVKVTSVVGSSPPTATAGSPFNVGATATLHNNGPAGPVNVDTTFTLVAPADCTIASTNPVTIEDTLLPVSVQTSAASLWTVTCTDPSNHTFTADAATVIDQLHATDSDTGNNSRSGGTTTGVTASTDVKLAGVSLAAPPSATGGSPFSVTVSGSLHNNGPFGPANVDTTGVLTMPGDCTTSSPNPGTVQDTSLPVSTATPVNVTWSVTCTSASNHAISATLETAVDQNHLTDTTTGNNQGNGGATTAIGATADIKITALTVSSPASFGAYAPFTVSATAALHNNGPSTPANADSSIGLTMPGDCTTASPNPQTVNNASLPASTSTPLPATWSVTCTTPSSHNFTVSASTVLDQLHSTDPNPANNSRSGNATTAIIPAKITVCKDVIPDDPSIWDFTITGPSPGAIVDLGDGECEEVGSNMIPGSYTVVEDFQLGYAPSVDCASNGFQSDGDITFTLDPGEQVTCQYVNAFHPGPNPVGGVAGLLNESEVAEGPRSLGSPGSGGKTGGPLLTGAIVTAIVALVCARGAWRLRREGR